MMDLRVEAVFPQEGRQEILLEAGAKSNLDAAIMLHDVLPLSPKNLASEVVRVALAQRGVSVPVEIGERKYWVKIT